MKKVYSLLASFFLLIPAGPAFARAIGRGVTARDEGLA